MWGVQRLPVRTQFLRRWCCSAARREGSRVLSSSSRAASTDNAVNWAELKRQFDDDGYCVVKNVLSSDLLKAIDDFSNAETAKMSLEQQEEHKFTGSLIPIVDPVFQPLLINPTLMQALDSLGFGTDIKWSCGFIISKPPGGPSLAWHQDCAVWDHEVAYQHDTHQFFAMYYLTDTSTRNGCLRVIPGTHRRRHAMHDILAGVEAHSDAARKVDLDALGPEHSDDVAESVDVCVEAGDVVLGDNRVLHGARRNASDARRTVITIWYHPQYEEQPDRVKKDFIAPVHSAFSSPIYYKWNKRQLAEAAGILPGVYDYPLITEDEVDADNHSLDTFDRSPRLEQMRGY